MFGVKVRQGRVAEFLLQIGETLVIGLGNRVRYGVDGFRGVGTGLPVDGA